MRLGTRYVLYSILASASPLILLLVVLQLLIQRELARLQSQEIDADSERVSRVVVNELDDVYARRSSIASDERWLPAILSSQKNDGNGSLDLIDLATKQAVLHGVDNIEVFDANGLLLARSGDYVNFRVPVEGGWYRHPDSLHTGPEISHYSAKPELWFSGLDRLSYGDSTVGYIKASRTIDGTKIEEWEHLTERSLAVRVIDQSALEPMIDSVGPGDKEAADSVAFRAPSILELGRNEEMKEFGGALAAVFWFGSMDGEAGPIVVGWVPKESGVAGLFERSLYFVVGIGVISVALSALLGYWFSRRLVVPLNELVDSAENIALGKFDRKIIWFANDEMGTLVNGFNTMYDRLRRSQEKLIESEKIAAWNQMARKVAHEIKNPLTPIQLSIEDLKRSYDTRRDDFGEILNTSVDTISAEIARLKRLTDEFSKFARLPAPKLVRLDVRRPIGDALRIYPEEIRTGRLKLSLPQEECIIELDTDLFSQAVNNLVKNALEATPDGGRVTVLGELGRSVFRIAVEDNGSGIAEEHVDKLFTPYFTTKKHGTGLGLVIAYRIIFDHGGKIRYEKAEPTGSRFVIVLPLARSDK